MPREDQLKALHVVVGVIANDVDQILIQQRRDGPFAGLWEFPGGKVEPNESVSDALVRELHEELGLGVFASSPLITITHAYPDRTVTLDTHVIEAHDGQVHGAEGQPIRWVPRAQLFDEPMLPADRPLSMAINLPDIHWTSADRVGAHQQGLEQLDEWLRLCPGGRAVAPTLALEAAADVAWVRTAVKRCGVRGARLILVGAPSLATVAVEAGAAGIQCSLDALYGVTERPISTDFLFGVSVKNGDELAKIAEVDADYAIFELGAAGFADDVLSADSITALRFAGVPVYVDAAGLDVAAARRHGAQGVVERLYS